MRLFVPAAIAAVALVVTACNTGPYPKEGVQPAFSFPVTSNDTPYSQCLRALGDAQGNHLPVFAVGEVADKTGQINYDENGYALSQGVSEMVISALAKTDKANLVERLDLRIPLAEVQLAEQGRLSRSADEYTDLPASDFVIARRVD